MLIIFFWLPAFQHQLSPVATLRSTVVQLLVFFWKKDGSLMDRLLMATDQCFLQKHGEPKKYTNWHTVNI